MGILYLTRDDVLLRREGASLVYRRKGARGRETVPLADLESVIILGEGGLTTPSLHLLFENHIPVHFLSSNGRYCGWAGSDTSARREIRLAQYQAAGNPARSLTVGRGVVAGKILQQRALLRRHASRRTVPGPLRSLLDELGRCASAAGTAPDMERLRGIEGIGARIYFQGFGLFFRPPWRFEGRNRRPPRDPINALLSFGYTLLLGHAVTALLAAGLDPCVGFLHPEFRGRPSAALDLMEEFRPLVDRLVLALANQGILSPQQFSFQEGSEGGCRMSEAARKRFLHEFEGRLNTEMRSPVTGQSRSIRGHLLAQGRHMARCLLREEDFLPAAPEGSP
jgi:CRISPR-associated endonuclease Cas1